MNHHESLYTAGVCFLNSVVLIFLFLNSVVLIFLRIHSPISLAQLLFAFCSAFAELMLSATSAATNNSRSSNEVASPAHDLTVFDPNSHDRFCEDV